MISDRGNKPVTSGMTGILVVLVEVVMRSDVPAAGPVVALLVEARATESINEVHCDTMSTYVVYCSETYQRPPK